MEGILWQLEDILSCRRRQERLCGYFRVPRWELANFLLRTVQSRSLLGRNSRLISAPSPPLVPPDRPRTSQLWRTLHKMCTCNRKRHSRLLKHRYNNIHIFFASPDCHAWGHEVKTDGRPFLAYRVCLSTESPSTTTLVLQAHFRCPSRPLVPFRHPKGVHSNLRKSPKRAPNVSSGASARGTKVTKVNSIAPQSVLFDP